MLKTCHPLRDGLGPLVWPTDGQTNMEMYRTPIVGKDMIIISWLTEYHAYAYAYGSLSVWWVFICVSSYFICIECGNHTDHIWCIFVVFFSRHGADILIAELETTNLHTLEFAVHWSCIYQPFPWTNLQILYKSCKMEWNPVSCIWLFSPWHGLCDRHVTLCAGHNFHTAHGHSFT